MEKVNMKSNNGRAKILGTLISVIGALTLLLYKGIPLIKPDQLSVSTNPSKKTKRFGLGSAFLSGGSLAWSSWFLIQTRIGQNFPYRYSSTWTMSFFSAIQSAILCFVTNRNVSEWVLKGEQRILSVVYGVSI